MISTLSYTNWDMRYGFHPYLWCNRKINKEFDANCIRKAFLMTWGKYKKNFYKALSKWMSPHEAMLKKVDMKRTNLVNVCRSINEYRKKKFKNENERRIRATRNFLPVVSI